jgi:hypothetical protein
MCAPSCPQVAASMRSNMAQVRGQQRLHSSRLGEVTMQQPVGQTCHRAGTHCSRTASCPSMVAADTK